MNLLVIFFVTLMSGFYAAAMYTMDDRNSTIQYFPSGAWLQGSDDREYAGTHTVASCHSADGCSMTIPFRGTGITLYVALGPAIGFQVSVDGGPKSEFQFGGVCNTSCGWRYNFSVFDVQALPFVDHNVELTLLDASGDVALASRMTNMRFDLAVVNVTNAFPTSMNANDTSPVGTDRPSKKSIIGPVVWGTVAVIAVIAIIVACHLPKRTRYYAYIPPPPPPRFPFPLEASYQNPHAPSHGPPEALQLWPSPWNPPQDPPTLPSSATGVDGRATAYDMPRTILPVTPDPQQHSPRFTSSSPITSIPSPELRTSTPEP